MMTDSVIWCNLKTSYIHLCIIKKCSVGKHCSLRFSCRTRCINHICQIFRLCMIHSLWSVCSIKNFCNQCLINNDLSLRILLHILYSFLRIIWIDWYVTCTYFLDTDYTDCKFLKAMHFYDNKIIRLYTLL